MKITLLSFLFALVFSSANAKTINVAIFNEMDEGTCISKCTNNPSVGASPFVTYGGLPSDYYLWLTG